MKNKTVFTPLEGDILHPGNLNIINKAKDLGSLIVGLFTDRAIANFKRTPLLDYNERVTVLENIKGINEIVPLDSIDFSDQLRKFKPDIVVHGDDWITGITKIVRDNVINVLKESEAAITTIVVSKTKQTKIKHIDFVNVIPPTRHVELRSLSLIDADTVIYKFYRKI